MRQMWEMLRMTSLSKPPVRDAQSLEYTHERPPVKYQCAETGYNSGMIFTVQGIDLMPATLPRTREAPDERTEREDGLSGPYVVILYNCECHTFEDVEVQLQKATACTLEKAEALAMEVHVTGRAVVYAGTAEKCEQVAGILRQIRLQVETDRA